LALTLLWIRNYEILNLFIHIKTPSMHAIISTCIGVLLALFIFVVLFWIVIAIVYASKKSAHARRGPDEYHKNIKSFRKLVGTYGRQNSGFPKIKNVHAGPKSPRCASESPLSD
jgi:hypothetical protein